MRSAKTINNRRKKLILNTVSSVIYQLVAIICGFILPRLFLQYYGSEINGLISSITQFIGLVALMELGIGAVVRSALYRPLAKSDYNEMSRIIGSARRFFNRVAILFIIYLFILIVIYPIVRGEFSFIYTASLIVILAMTSIVQYFFGITYQLLLMADQKVYVTKIIAIVTLIINTILSILFIINGASIHIVKFISTLVLLLKPMMLHFYVNKYYKIDRTIKITDEPIKQKWNGIAQHIASFVLANTDIIVLTIYSDLMNVSVYSIYSLVVTGIKQAIMAFVTGIQSLFGNMLANEEYNALKKRFLQFEWIMHTIVTLFFSCTAVLIVPFIKVYTKGITDTNYIRPYFGLLITFAVGVYCLRLPYNVMVLAAGHYKQTQTSAIIEMSINLILSIILVSKIGLIGVAIGTLVAMIYRTVYLAYYLSNNIIEYKFNTFLRHILVDFITVGLILKTLLNIGGDISSYWLWFILALKVFFIGLSIVLVVNAIFYRKQVLKNSFLKRKFKELYSRKF